jgi:uncharacterized cupredoxin-like copper-binding protein
MKNRASKKIFMGLTVLLLTLTGCASSDSGEVQTVTVATTGMAFDSNELKVIKGKPMKLVLQNKDTVEHDWTITTIPHSAKKGGGHAHGVKADVHVHTAVGKTESIQFTPTKDGTYTFYCTVAGHRDAGMEGKLIVQ